jgi:hypothetical protein
LIDHGFLSNLTLTKNNYVFTNKMIENQAFSIILSWIGLRWQMSMGSNNKYSRMGRYIIGRYHRVLIIIPTFWGKNLLLVLQIRRILLVNLMMTNNLKNMCMIFEEIKYIFTIWSRRIENRSFFFSKFLIFTNKKYLILSF